MTRVDRDTFRRFIEEYPGVLTPEWNSEGDPPIRDWRDAQGILRASHQLPAEEGDTQDEWFEVDA
ncbi:hypothetical protein SAMN07250955_10646 [Arboricoccus pini]|uniref:Uncharacterized protein n=1 Tax=Arboricoccus pini TaxID=1963835 RepID=A0A212R6I9_9PROT|nr:hypothetical protein [Arboricoccus pini]SNB67774.1 hypothetical protein SAMN07250955_10646 [Arboricoccus pini]